MNHLNQHPQDSLSEALRPFFKIDLQRFTVLAVLILAIIHQRSVVLNNLKSVIQLPGYFHVVNSYRYLFRVVRLDRGRIGGRVEQGNSGSYAFTGSWLCQ